MLLIHYCLLTRFKGPKEIRKSPKYEMSYEDDVASLVIHQTEPLDAGVYKCQATNVIGSIQTEGTLSVHSKYMFLSGAMETEHISPHSKYMSLSVSMVTKRAMVEHSFYCHCRHCWLQQLLH